MIAEIDLQRETLGELCRKHRVRRLEVFGSAADGTFDAARSDIDFLVEHLPLQPARIRVRRVGINGDWNTAQTKVCGSG